MNIGDVGVVFFVYIVGSLDVLCIYMVEVGKCLLDKLVVNVGGVYDFMVYGLNGFLCCFVGKFMLLGLLCLYGCVLEVKEGYDVVNGNL